MTTYPYRADIVGSFLRPAALKQANADFRAGKIDREALTQVEDREIDHLVDQQVKAGLKDVTAGEFRRSWWHLDFLGGLNGAEFFTPDHGFVFNGQETRAGAIRINGKIAFNPQHPFFDDFSYLKQIVPAGIAAKQTIPSPSVLFPNEDAMIYDNYYHDFDAFLADEIKAYQETVQHFYDLGCRTCKSMTPHGACGLVFRMARSIRIWYYYAKQRLRQSMRLRTINLTTLC